MTSYSGIIYLFVFLPFIVLGYSIITKKMRPYFMLLAGYVFFMLISGKLVLFLILTTLFMYLTGLWIDKIKAKCKATLAGVPKEEKKIIKEEFKKKQRRVVTLFVLTVLLVIVILKYVNFIFGTINIFLVKYNTGLFLKYPEFVLPIGLSFYTFMAISYVVDVYRDVIPADRNFLRVALFMGFFPDIMEGPFVRYTDTANDIYECRDITYENLTFGCQRILYGMLKKIVIADRFNGIIVNIFSSFDTVDGGVSVLGMVLYTIQLYCEFSGTMDIVIGSAEIFGVKIPENFKRPFFSKTISEFWTRWHITLGTWFKDYIYYPVSMSSGMKNLTKKARKRMGNHYGPLMAGTVALFLVWLANGLWHGAGWIYVFFGMYHFVWITIGNLLDPLVKKFVTKTGFNRNVWWYKSLQVIRTFIIVCFGELIFRGEGMRAVVKMYKSIFNNFSLKFITDGRIYTMGMDKCDWIITAFALIVVIIFSVLSERGVDIRRAVAKKNIVIRWSLYLLLIMFIVIFGAYGEGYLPVDPIYAGF